VCHLGDAVLLNVAAPLNGLKVMVIR
jgi:hypothetical protein